MGTCGMIWFREAQEKNSQCLVTVKGPVVCSYRLQLTNEAGMLREHGGHQQTLTSILCLVTVSCAGGMRN